MGQTQQRTLDWAMAINNRPWRLDRHRRLDTAVAKQNTPDSSNLPPPGRTQTIQVHSVIHLKGETIAKAVTTHQARAANRPNTSVPYFDPTMGVLPIGMN